MFYKNDWLSWTYDGVKFGNKTTPQSKFEFQFKKTVNQPLKSHKEELLENTRAIRERFNDPFDLLFSGGVDSEVILRCHHELKIPINVFIFKYENDYNFHDVRHALRICDELNIKPNLIDFNLQKFFENDAYDIWTKTYVKKAGRLPHMKMIEYLDNMPIMGDAEPLWEFDNNSWKFCFEEVCHSQSIYCSNINRLIIADWYEFSPETLLSHALLPKIKLLFKNKNHDDLIFDRTKYFIYKEIWPEIVIRPKRNGYEGFNARPKYQDPTLTYIQEFQNKFITPTNISNERLQYNEEELFTLLSFP
jgi:hypothetical protein